MVKIRAARERLGIPQGKLAQMIGTTQGAVSQWELGITRPETGKLKKLAEILQTTVDELLEEGKVG